MVSVRHTSFTTVFNEIKESEVSLTDIIKRTLMNSMFRSVILNVVVILLLILSANVMASYSLLLGYPGDPTGSIWGFWWSREHSSSLLAPNQAFPYLVGKILGFFISPLAVYNAWVLIASWLSIFVMYSLLNKILKNRAVAISCAIIFAIMPARQMQLYQHLTLSDWFWYPMILLLIIRLKEHKSWLNAFYIALAGLLALTDSYYNLLLIVPIIFCGLIWVGYEWRRTPLAFKYLILTIASFIGGIIILSRDILFDQASFTSSVIVRPLDELQYYSARWWSYLFPSTDHPLWGQFFLPAVQSQLSRGNVFELTQFLSWTMVATCILFAILAIVRKKDRLVSNSLFWMIASIFVLSLLFSYVSTIQIGTVTISSLGQLIYPLLPYFRVYARFGFIVSTAIVILFAIAIKTSHWRLQAILIALVLIELMPSIPLSNIAPPPVVQYLVSQPSGSVINYPFVPANEIRTNQYLYWQIIHSKLVIVPDKDDALSILNTLDEGVFGRQIAQYSPKYVVIHTTIYSEGRLPRKMQRYFDPGFALFPPTIWQNPPRNEWLLNLNYVKIYDDVSGQVWRQL